MQSNLINKCKTLIAADRFAKEAKKEIKVCFLCRGTGKCKDKICSSCEGTGYVFEKEIDGITFTYPWKKETCAKKLENS